nr:hypothetical protein Iba_chr08aCG11160 [Ipomoea batatas]
MTQVAATAKRRESVRVRENCRGRPQVAAAENREQTGFTVLPNPPAAVEFTGK